MKKEFSQLSPSRILVNQTAYLGDVILSTALVRAIHNYFKKSSIDIICTPQSTQVFKYNPYIRNRLIFPKKNFHQKLRSFFRLLKEIKRNQYDLALSVQGSITSSLLMYLGGIPRRVGFRGQKLITDPIPFEEGIHSRLRHLKLLEKPSGESFHAQTEIFWSKKEEQKVLSTLKNLPENILKIGIAPGSVRNTKMWPDSYFIKLLNQLQSKNMIFFLIGSEQEKHLCERIAGQTRAEAVIVAGDFSILESAALINRLHLMISNDSAPLHIANAVETDVIAIFGPTVKKFGFYPYRKNDRVLEMDLYCRPCSKHGGKRCPEGHFRCMLDLTPEFVSKQVLLYFDDKQLHHGATSPDHKSAQN
jgi:heptosyltransferase-2